MKIQLHEITIRELTEGYRDNLEDGIRGYSGKLDFFTLILFNKLHLYKPKQIAK